MLSSGAKTPVVSFRTSANEDVVVVIFGADSARMGVGYEDSLVELWDLSSTTAPLFAVKTENNLSTSDIVFAADGSQLITADLSGVANVFDAETGEHLFELAGHDTAVVALAPSPNGNRVATADRDGGIRVWDAARAGGGEVLAFTVGTVEMDMDLNPNDTVVAIGGSNGPAQLFDAATGQLLLTLPGEENTAVYSTAFRPDGARIATVGEDNAIRVWDARSGELLVEWIGHRERGNTGGFFTGTIDIAYSADGKRLATAGTDGAAKVWDAETRAELMVLAGHTAGLTKIVYSPDGRLLATGSDQPDTTVKVWDAETGVEIYSLDAQPIRAWGLAFSPDSTRLATGGTGGVLNVWDMTTGEMLYEMPAQVSTILSVTFTPDGEKLISGGGDAVRIFDAETGEELQVITAMRGNIAVTQDGRHLYFIFDDARVFPCCLRILSRLLTRDLRAR